MTATISGRGTDEAVWSPWLDDQVWPSLDLDAVGGRRVVVLAAHPDDEILGVGGLLGALSRRHHKLVLIWATDGEASHPDTTAVTPAELGRIRRIESSQAVARLGVDPVATHHLGLPDSGLAAHRESLDDALASIVCPGDLVLAPWVHDGHPDHEALGAAAARPGTTVWHYPVWMWHWAHPGDDRIPWERLRSTPVASVEIKTAAIAAFISQIEPLGPHAGDAAILPPHVLERFLRPREWVFV